MHPRRGTARDLLQNFMENYRHPQREQTLRPSMPTWRAGGVRPLMETPHPTGETTAKRTTT